MGSILITVPDFSDEDLVFDEDETKRILMFFWPSRRDQISTMAINNEVRRLAQTALVAGIDGTYAMGYMKIVLQTVLQPGNGIKAFGQKLAKRFVKHWWKHARENDLRDAKVAESIRVSVALALGRHLGEIFEGAAAPRGPLQWYANVEQGGKVWG